MGKLQNTANNANPQEEVSGRDLNALHLRASLL